MNGRLFIVRVRKWARSRNLEVRFVASEGAGSHGTLYAGNRRTTVKDRKKEIGKGLLGNARSRSTSGRSTVDVGYFLTSRILVVPVVEALMARSLPYVNSVMSTS